jgi:hypothetical protein
MPLSYWGLFLRLSLHFRNSEMQRQGQPNIHEDLQGEFLEWLTTSMLICLNKNLLTWLLNASNINGKERRFLNNYNNFNDLLNTFLVLLSIFDQLKCTQSTVVKIISSWKYLVISIIFIQSYIKSNILKCRCWNRISSIAKCQQRHLPSCSASCWECHP